MPSRIAPTYPRQIPCEANYMAIRAALFDIDGTLVDSNYLHIAAWARAFEDVGHPMDAWRIHRSIGMDGEKLMDALLKCTDSTLRKRAQDHHSTHYARSAKRLRPFEGARELLRALGDGGLTVVLATSAPESELAALRAEFEIGDAVDVVTSSEDVDMAKPAPDVVQVALERAAVPASDAAMVGDSVWDMEAAVAAGVTCVWTG